MNSHQEKLANRLADKIVKYVERANRPVTLCEITREISGFSKPEPPAWDCHCEYDGAEIVLWTDMTEKGAAALHKVIFGHRLTIQPVNRLLYLLDGGFIKRDDWQPIVLLPVKAANLDTPKTLYRLPEAVLAEAKTKPGWRQLTPDPNSATAGWFSM